MTNIKVSIKFSENGPTRSLNRLIKLTLALIVLILFLYNTDYAIDAEIMHNDLTVQTFLSGTKLDPNTVKLP